MVAKAPRLSKNCACCGATMQVRPSRYQRTRFCSKRCQGYDYAKWLNAVKPPSKSYAEKISKTLLGRYVGRESPAWIEPTSFRCRNCGSIFLLKPWEIRRRRNPMYCSAACRDSFRARYEAGENSPFWVGGPQTYRGRAWSRTRKAVVVEQQGRCADCQRLVGHTLPVHHIRPFREFDKPDQANARENLVGLCQPCHIRREWNGGPIGPQREAAAAGQRAQWPWSSAGTSSAIEALK